MDKRTLDQFEKEIPQPEHERPDVTLFHYTDAKGLRGILGNKCIWATHYLHLNDREEIKIGERCFCEEVESFSKDPSLSVLHRRLFKTLFREYQRLPLTSAFEIFIASFSEARDLLSQWRAYAPNGGGYSIGIDSTLPQENKEPGGTVAYRRIRCEYGEDAFREEVRKKLRSIAEKFEETARKYAKDENDLNEIYRVIRLPYLRWSMFLIPKLKHWSFSEEKEWRYVIYMNRNKRVYELEFRSSVRGVVPYLCFPLTKDESPNSDNRISIREVYVGPCRNPDANEKSTRMLLKTYGYDEEIIRLSEIPLRV